jgi:hypothetical protein
MTLDTPGIRPAQDTPRKVYDGISERDRFIREQMERGSQQLLRAMIRELQAMGARP